MVILPLALLGLMTAFPSCSPAETGPRAWIDWPRDGYETDVGTTVTSITQAYGREGVAEDTVGNKGPWSGWAKFTVQIT
jgi:hypothetical protein